ncbi:EndoU domain-containing protein, partial [Ciceribacter sp. RN22]|uniref:EndoU domain-containing protein n=1 Tax=Ciceribacter sp. RN22 TaxID=2954932 RepID=UPI002092D5DC
FKEAIEPLATAGQLTKEAASLAIERIASDHGLTAQDTKDLKLVVGVTTAVIIGAVGTSGFPKGTSLISSARANHILYGDNTGGGHLWPGGPGKSAFPQSWSATKVLEEIHSIAADPSITGRVQGNGRIVKEAMVDGVNIRVVVESPANGGGVVTGYPTNVPRNR